MIETYCMAACDEDAEIDTDQKRVEHIAFLAAAGLSLDEVRGFTAIERKVPS